jgi:ribosomal protein S18 acetylase RimI-like enzyme
MHAGLGIFRTAERLARFQDVDTHRDHRRQGLASHLLLAAGHYAHQQLGAATLVIAADPDYQAIGPYRSLGFVDREQYMTFEALPAEG